MEAGVACVHRLLRRVIAGDRRSNTRDFSRSSKDVSDVGLVYGSFLLALAKKMRASMESRSGRKVAAASSAKHLSAAVSASHSFGISE